MILTENVNIAIDLAANEMDETGRLLQADLFELMSDDEFDTYMLAVYGIRN